MVSMLVFTRLSMLLFVFLSATLHANENAQEELEQVIQANKGKVIYIDFWASWCKPCRESFPWMNNMKGKYEKDGLFIISINLDADKSYATEFLDEVPATFDVIYDPKGITARKLKIKGMPSSYLIDRSGKLVSGHNGFNDEKKKLFEQEIKDLLQ